MHRLTIKGIFSTLAALIASVFAARTKRFRTLIMAIVLLVPILGTILNIGSSMNGFAT